MNMEDLKMERFAETVYQEMVESVPEQNRDDCPPLKIMAGAMMSVKGNNHQAMVHELGLNETVCGKCKACNITEK